MEVPPKNTSKGMSSVDLTSHQLSFDPTDFHECSSVKEMANKWVKMPEQKRIPSKDLDLLKVHEQTWE